MNNINTFNINSLFACLILFFPVIQLNGQYNTSFLLKSDSLSVPAAKATYSYTPGSFTASWNSVQNADGYLLDLSDNYFFNDNTSGILILERFSQSELPCGWSGNIQSVGIYTSPPKGVLLYRHYALKSQKFSFINQISFNVRSESITNAQICLKYRIADSVTHIISYYNVNSFFQNITIDLSDNGIKDLSDLQNISFLISSDDDNLYIDDFKAYTPPGEFPNLTGFKNLIVNDTLHELSGLLECKKYYYRVRAYTATDTSEYSNIIEVDINNSNVCISPNSDKPHRACDFKLYVPSSYQRILYGSELTINDIRYSSKELFSGDTFYCTFGGLKPDSVYDFDINLSYGSLDIYNTNVKYKTAASPKDEIKTVLLIIDNELDIPELEEKFTEYENDIKNLYPGFTSERYYLDNTLEEKRLLYNYIKEKYLTHNLYFLFFIGENASIPVYFERVADDGTISPIKNRENFSFYIQIYNNMYEYDSVQSKFVNRVGTGLWEQPDLYSRILSNGSIDINYGVIISPMDNSQARAVQTKNYLEKLHNFRSGIISFDKRALFSNTWEDFGNPSLNEALGTNPRWTNNKCINTTHIPSSDYHGTDPAWTNNYLYSIENESFEICYLKTHGAPTYHYFDIRYDSIASLTKLNTALFSLMACNNAAYTVYNFMCGTYLMQGNVLATEGFTEPTFFVSAGSRDSSFDPGSKYYSISTGSRFSSVLNRTMSSHVFFGDPLLSLNDHVMFVDSCSSAQSNIEYVKPGDKAQEILQIQVYTDGDLKAKKEVQFHFRNSCTSSEDILSVRLFSTGSSSDFDTLSQVGKTINDFDESVIFSDSVNLKNGTNYFWLAYDLATNATNNNVVDAEFDSLIADGEVYRPTMSSSEGDRKIYDKECPVILPWTEAFEDVGIITEYVNNHSNIIGLPWWSIFFTEPYGRRLDLSPDLSWCHDGVHAAKMEVCPPYYTNSYLTANINLGNYIDATDLELSFWYKSDNILGEVTDKVEIRGADSLKWIEIYDLSVIRDETGIWHHIEGIDIDSILLSEGQKPSSSFGLRFNLENDIYSSIHCAIDDITITGSPQIDFLTHPVNQSICENDTACFFIETLNAASLNYQWYKNGIALCDTNGISGSHSAVVTILDAGLTDTGYYACMVQNPGQSRKSDSAFLEVFSNPTIVIDGDTSFCAESFTEIEYNMTGKPPWDITLSYNSVLDTIHTSLQLYPDTVNAEVFIEIESIADANTCKTSYINNYIDITEIPLPTASILNDTIICEGTRAYLWVSLGGIAPWNVEYRNLTDTSNMQTYESTFFICDSVENEYRIISLTDAAQCTGKELGEEAIIEVMELPVAGFICYTDALEVEFINTSENADNYLWDFGDESTSNLTDPIHTYESDGSYSVVLTAYNGFCASLPYSEPITLVSENLQESLSESFFEIYPNPCAGILTIISKVALSDNWHIFLINAQGLVVYSEDVWLYTEQYHLDLSSLIGGIYILHLERNNTVFNEKVVIILN
ncbi:MAG: T9SS type A sorting domain-containing protein [Bacteroidales bacterium]|nr:T9SS type A sorting domain-containing protein [Bacteroidales bacterium]